MAPRRGLYDAPLRRARAVVAGLKNEPHRSRREPRKILGIIGRGRHNDVCGADKTALRIRCPPGIGA